MASLYNDKVNENEWMNVFHSVMQPFNLSFEDYNYLVLACPD